jgi:hypothetical protein
MVNSGASSWFALSASHSSALRFTKPTMASPIHKAWTKAIRTDDSTPGYSASWVTAARGWLEVYEDRLECGEFVIPLTSIKSAKLYEARQWFIPVYILAVTTADGTYQFGVNPWTKIGSKLPFEFTRERVRLKYSQLSIAIRVALVAYVIYLIYRRVSGG